MLLHRVLTAFALLVVILAAVFGLSEQYFLLFITFVVGLGAWEWTALAGLKVKLARSIYMLAMLLVMYMSLHLPAMVSLMAGIVFWLAALVFVCLYPRGKQLWGNSAVLFIAGFLLFIPGWRAFVFLREQEFFAFHLLLLPGLVAAADTGAYFSGRAFGKHKLAVRVSPNKTWEGFVGGVLASCLLIALVAVLLIGDVLELTASVWASLVVSVLLIAASSVLGDLFESMIKRFSDVKDSGNILPGHGGMLDRIDGLTAAAPVYGLILMLVFQGST